VAGKLEIAVIDDDDSFRGALVESLSSLGYGCSGFASAEAYLRVIGKKSLNCIVTDIHMPGMSGLDLVNRLAARGSPTRIPVVLITACADSDLEAKAAAAGAACLLRKPFEINDLIECIEGAVKASP
jgi:FixJ family two-component response regulator